MRSNKKYIPKHIKKFGKTLIKSSKNTGYFLICFVNKYFRKNTFLQYKKLHVGCGSIRMHDFINVDYRATNAADMSMDCSELSYFPSNHFTLIFANAFFEHLYRKKRVGFIESCHRLLTGK